MILLWTITTTRHDTTKANAVPAVVSGGDGGVSVHACRHARAAGDGPANDGLQPWDGSARCRCRFRQLASFALLVVTVPLEAFAVFSYRTRPLQAKLCSWSIVFCLAWYVYYAFALHAAAGDEYAFHLQFAACLPLVAVIALFLARRGVIHDEKLVRSADRLR